MSKKIKVIASPSTTSTKTFIFQPIDHGFTDKEWEKLPNDDKHDQVRQFLEGIPEHPYWSLDYFEDK